MNGIDAGRVGVGWDNGGAVNAAQTVDADSVGAPRRSAAALLASLTATRAGCLVHAEDVPPRDARYASWPAWADAEVVAAFARTGIQAPWEHQVQVAEHARAGRSVVVSTGTSSGKSLAFLLPTLTAVREGLSARDARGATVLYLSPTKALAADQLRVLDELAVPGLRAATYDGDTPTDERDWVRAHASYVLTNPDMLHHSLLPGHQRWAAWWKGLRYVVVDECHVYRGVFGSHVAAVLRRLRRMAAHYGAEPTFVLASATVANAEAFATTLLGTDVVAVTDDASPRSRRLVGLWEPPLREGHGEHGAPLRRTSLAETADLLADLTVEGCRSLAFIRSRRGAEAVALMTREHLAEVDPDLASSVAAYRGGYLPEERRELEAALVSGRLRALATTNALELGIDVTGLDAVLLAGWPGTLASLWQQVGRAGRRGADALALFVARDDPLDTYLVHHPQAVFGRPVEAAVLDPDNPYVLRPHLCAAAAELPLTEADLEAFGPNAPGIVAELVDERMLRARPTGWYWTREERAASLADLRGTGGSPVRVVEDETGRLLGTVDHGAADATVHAGAVYLHRSETYVVASLDLDEGVAVVRQERPDWSTTARTIADIRVLGVRETVAWRGAVLHLGDVEVTSQVVAFLRRRLVTGAVLGEEPLDLPVRRLRTTAVWWTLPDAAATGVAARDLPGALHAAEHAAIGLLPLVATCDRWDIGGVSTALHADTGLPTVFVHDGHPGGAGFAERGFRAAGEWLTATFDAVSACECETGCPSCVQSPKCGNGNDPLDKAGALRVLAHVLDTG